MKAYVPLMAAAQVVIFMGMWWLEAQQISNVSTGLKAVNSTSCPLDGPFMRPLVRWCSLPPSPGLLSSSPKGQRLQFALETSNRTRFDAP